MNDPIASVSPRDMLRELDSAVRAGLERHLSATSEWFPHEYVPYEVGRNYLHEPWENEDSDLSPVSRTALEVNLVTEDNLPYYHLALWEMFGRDGAWGEWVRRWTAEEGRHAIVLRDYLTVTRGMDPVMLERGRMDAVCRGFYPNGVDGSFGDPLDGIVYATLQELATRISHRNTGTFTRDPLIEKLTARIATDENLHYVFYRDLAAAAFEIDPSAAMLALRRQVIGFQMPGAGMARFSEKARAMARVRIYNLGIHLEQVLRPILFTHWKITEIEGLSDEAASARDDVLAYLARLERVAGKLGEPSAPALALVTEG